MRSRMLTLILAIVTGAVAVAIVFVYVQRVEDETTRGRRTVGVLVANQTLEAGTSWAEIINTGAADSTDIPLAYVTTGALGGSEDLRADEVLARDIVPGEQLTSQAFENTAQDAFAAGFKKGTEGLGLPVERVRGVAGHVEAGDRLNAFATTDESTTLIAEAIEVVEVQPAAEGDPAGLDMMVVEVKRSQAVDLINAQEQAGLWFTLVTDGGP